MNYKDPNNYFTSTLPAPPFSALIADSTRSMQTSSNILESEKMKSKRLLIVKCMGSQDIFLSENGMVMIILIWESVIKHVCEMDRIRILSVLKNAYQNVQRHFLFPCLCCRKRNMQTVFRRGLGTYCK